MKTLRHFLFAACALIALTCAAGDPDPIISSIDDAYQHAKELTKKNKSLGNEMVTTINYTVRGQGKTTETLHFFYNTAEGTYLLDDDGDPHFFYYPLYLVTRKYNIGKKKYYEEYLFDSQSQRLLFVSTQDYDQNGKRFDRRFYIKDGSVYKIIGPAMAPFMEDNVIYMADDLLHAFDWIIRNPKE